MDIRGLLLVNSAESTGETGQSPAAMLMGTVDVVGKTPLQRMAERFQQYGISSISAVVEGDAPVRSYGLPANVTCASAAPDRFWKAAESAFNDMAQSGAELVILIRMGSYAEIDLEAFVQYHIDRQSRVTQMAHEQQPLEIFCISASRRNDAASLFRTQLSKCRTECPLFEHQGYFNELATPRDLRQFAIDILTLQTQTCPAGREVRPGVWVVRGASVEKGARVLAPAFIGALARIRSGAVITRCSSVENHAVVDCGTVIENSTVLPYSYVGAGLDLAHSVVGMGKIVNLRRDVTVEIADPKLVSAMAITSSRRLLNSAAEVLTYLPKMAWQGMSTAAKLPEPDLHMQLRQTPPALGNAAGYEAPACDTETSHKFPNMVVARRYGHQ